MYGGWVGSVGEAKGCVCGVGLGWMWHHDQGEGVCMGGGGALFV